MKNIEVGESSAPPKTIIESAVSASTIGREVMIDVDVMLKGTFS